MRSTSTGGQAGSRSSRTRSAALARAAGDEARGLLDHGAERLRPALDGSPAGEGAQPADGLPRPARLLGRARHRLPRPRHGGRVAGGEQALRRIGVVGDRGQRLVELMGEHGGELAERAEARDLRQLLFQHREPRLRPAQRLVGAMRRGDVARHLRGPDQRARRVVDRGDGEGHAEQIAVLAPPPGLVMLDPRARADALEHAGHVVLVAGRRQNGDGPAQHLGFGVAEQALRGRIPAGHPAIQRGADDRVVRRRR